MGKLVAISVIGSALLLGLAEGVIRWTGLDEGCSVAVSADGRLVCDPILGFRLNPEAELRAYPPRNAHPAAPKHVSLNSAGFRTHEFGPKAYPLQLEELLFDRTGTRKFEVLNAGQGGYNSYHGVMLMRTKLRNLEPDLVTVRYGWNDLFASPPVPRLRGAESAVGLAVEDFLLRISLYVFLRRLRLEVSGRIAPFVERARKSVVSERAWHPSVPLEDYARNLRRIVELSRARDAEVWFLTTPHNPSPDPVVMSKIERMNKLSWKKLVEVLDSYNETTRTVGDELDSPRAELSASC